ncbi:MAG: NAD(P)-binding domain-containing protein [Lachnospiraceae bacterium]|nr:NAD(P)-binding domain-containing protein [Lachnospiraceae bacterium]
MKIGFIGYGDAASGLCRGLVTEEGADIVIYGRDHKKTSDRAAELGNSEKYAVVKELRELLDVCEVVCVTVPCSADDEVFSQIVSLGVRKGAIYADMCSATPEQKKKNAKAVEDAGGRFADVSIMDAVRKILHKTPLLASGSAAEDFRKIMTSYNMDVSTAGDEPGRAALVKLCRSIFLKGIIALAIETEDVSRNLGVYDEVFDSIAVSWDTNKFMDYMPKQIRGMKEHCVRMKAETEECLETAKSAGIPGYMTEGTISLLGSLTEDKMI